MWYAIVDAAAVGLEITPERGRDIVRMGEMIKVATRE
jgi:proline racemase